MGRGTFKMCNFSFSLFPLFLVALISFHLSLFLSLSMLPEQRVLQMDQAGLAYWKQMADQRQEGHGFMKRAPNMPGSCRGPWPWMTAARCEREFKWAFCASLSFFFGHLFSPVCRLTRCIKDLMALKPPTAGVSLQFAIANQRLMLGIHQIWAKQWCVR